MFFTFKACKKFQVIYTSGGAAKYFFTLQVKMKVPIETSRPKTLSEDVSDPG